MVFPMLSTSFRVSILNSSWASICLNQTICPNPIVVEIKTDQKPTSFPTYKGQTKKKKKKPFRHLIPISSKLPPCHHAWPKTLETPKVLAHNQPPPSPLGRILPERVPVGHQHESLVERLGRSLPAATKVHAARDLSEDAALGARLVLVLEDAGGRGEIEVRIDDVGVEGLDLVADLRVGVGARCRGGRGGAGRGAFGVGFRGVVEVVLLEELGEVGRGGHVEAVGGDIGGVGGVGFGGGDVEVGQACGGAAAVEGIVVVVYEDLGS